MTTVIEIYIYIHSYRHNFELVLSMFHRQNFLNIFQALNHHLWSINYLYLQKLISFPHFALAQTGLFFHGFVHSCLPSDTIHLAGAGAFHIFLFLGLTTFIYQHIFFKTILQKDVRGILLNTSISEKALFLALN